MQHPHPCLQIIRDEHAALSAVLRSLMLLLAEQRRRELPVDFQVVRAILFYIDEFPEREHHPKESELLFPRVRSRYVSASALLDRLDREHVRSARAVLELEREVLALEMLADSHGIGARRRQFEDEVERYVLAYLEHMRIEETEVLPLAERVLAPGDWADLDVAFMRNRDPVTHRDPEDAFRPLFMRILMALPAPIGLPSGLEGGAALGA